MTTWWDSASGRDDFRNGHIIPDEDAKPHENRADCWCHPVCTGICPECDGGGDAGCWRCAGDGYIESSPAPCGRLYIHNALDEQGK